MPGMSKPADDETLTRSGEGGAMWMKGADMVVEALRREQVEVIFGYPGGAVLPLYDALYQCGIRHVLTRHEQGAIHAAEGYARVTGKPGVVIATSGPGATNLVTGLADAMMDSIPLVAITGQVAKTGLAPTRFRRRPSLASRRPSQSITIRFGTRRRFRRSSKRRSTSPTRAVKGLC